MGPNNANIERDPNDRVTVPPITGDAEHGQPKKCGSSFELYISSLVIIIIWIAFIIGFIVDQELAVAHATKVVHKPFVYDAFPGICFTIFSQAHLPITTLHLARLGVSALDFCRARPRSWTELFWMADANWSQPVGMFSTAMGWSKSRFKLKISGTFLLFTSISIIATMTPVALNRAYVLSTVYVNENITLFINTTSPQLIIDVDGTQQLAFGGGSWSTGRTVLSLFNTSTFTPPDNDRNGSSMFFSTDLEGRDIATASYGIRLSGSCKVQNNESDHNILNKTSHDHFVTACKSENYTKFTGDDNRRPSEFGVNSTVQWNNTKFQSIEVWYQACTNVSDGTEIGWQTVNGTGSNATTAGGIVWFRATNSSETGPSSYIAQGSISCSATFSYGNAMLNGSSLTYTAFNATSLQNSVDKLGGWPIEHPLYAAMSILGSEGHPAHYSTSNSSALSAYEPNAWLARIGLRDANRTALEDPMYKLPNLYSLADNFWDGVAHMANGIVLATAAEVNNTAVQQAAATGYVRDIRFAAVAWALLAIWAVLVISATVILFRPTFMGSLNSYTVARIVLEEPDFSEGVLNCSVSDDLESNRMLQREFTWRAKPVKSEHVGEDQITLLPRIEETEFSKELFEGLRDCHSNLDATGSVASPCPTRTVLQREISDSSTVVAESVKDLSCSNVSQDQTQEDEEMNSSGQTLNVRRRLGRHTRVVST